MLFLRDLGIKTGLKPREKFAHLLTNEWTGRFPSLFKSQSGRVISVFEAAHDTFLSEKPKITVLGEVPDEHRLRHAEFIFRSFGPGWKIKHDISTDLAELDNPKWKISNSLNARANMLYGLDLVLSFLEKFPELADGAKLEFFQKLVEAGMLKDPLFLLRMLGRFPEAYPRKQQAGENFAEYMLHFAEYATSNSEVGESPVYPEITDPFFPYKEKDIAELFGFEHRPPLELDGKLAFYAADGQPGQRVAMLPEEIELESAKSLASIIVYGIVPGGVVGGTINHDMLYLALGRPDIDLLTVYPETQAVVIVPTKTVTAGEYPTKILPGGAKVWHNGDKALAPRLSVHAKENGELPRISGEGVVAAVPLKLIKSVQDNLYKLAMNLKVNAEEHESWSRRIIPYDPAHWGGIHSFSEFLQLTEKGKQIMAKMFGNIE